GPSDAYDVLETAINQYLKLNKRKPTGSSADAVSDAQSIENLLNKIPTQTNRSGEKDALQQFSTPPHYSYAVAWAANIDKNDIVLEPSAGTGSLAIHALNAGPKEINVNELSERRRKLLKIFGFDNIFGEDAEQIHNILPQENRPSVVLMNPPFSKTAGRMGDKKVQGTDLKHIDAALAYLQDGGRLVAIMGRPLHEEQGESSRFKNWLKKVQKEHNVRANVFVGRKVYKKYGTQFPTRVLIIDKTGPQTGKIVGGTVDTIPDLLHTIQGVRNDRQRVKQEPSRTVVPEEGKRPKPAIPVQPPVTPAVTIEPGERPDRPLAAGPAAAPKPSRADVRVGPAQGPADVTTKPEPGRPEKVEVRRAEPTTPGKPGQGFEMGLRSTSTALVPFWLKPGVVSPPNLSETIHLSSRTDVE
ncbi:hypothetical protein LCGC14_2783820, partial [marine sediment metagenome]